MFRMHAIIQASEQDNKKEHKVAHSMRENVSFWIKNKFWLQADSHWFILMVSLI